jgi:hypothetical protein
LSPLPLCWLDRTGGEEYVTACLKALQKGENGSPTMLWFSETPIQPVASLCVRTGGERFRRPGGHSPYRHQIKKWPRRSPLSPRGLDQRGVALWPDTGYSAEPSATRSSARSCAKPSTVTVTNSWATWSASSYWIGSSAYAERSRSKPVAVTICVLILCLRVVWSITLFTSPGRRKAMSQMMYLVIGAIVIIVLLFIVTLVL